MLELKEKIPKIFRGLDSKDYEILEFFRENGPASRYDANKALGSKIPKSTLYRRVNALKEKGFLKVSGKREFVRGTLNFQVELLDLSFKGFFASLKTVRREDFPRITAEDFPIAYKDKNIQKMDPDSLYELCDFLVDYMIDAGQDLTDNKNFDLAYFNLIFLSAFVKWPERGMKLLKKCFPEHVPPEELVQTLMAIKRQMEI